MDHEEVYSYTAERCKLLFLFLEIVSKLKERNVGHLNVRSMSFKKDVVYH